MVQASRLPLLPGRLHHNRFPTGVSGRGRPAGRSPKVAAGRARDETGRTAGLGAGGVPYRMAGMKRNKLKAAIRAGDLAKVRQLIAAGVDVSEAFADGTKPILLAAREHQIVILRALAGAGADMTDLEALNFEERLMLFFDSSLDVRPDDDLMSSDELSAWAERAVAELMDPKLAAEIAAHEGAVFRAVRTGDLELLKERVAAGDDVDQIRDITRDTPLTLAVQKGDEEMIRELIAAGADLNHAGFSTPLSFALPDLRLAKLLLDAGADVYARGLDRRTALERAIHRVLHPSSSDDSLLLVRFFLEAGAHPQNCESFPGTLLMEAEYSEAWELYHELLPHYSEEVARESFRELEYQREEEQIDGGVYQWGFDLDYAARHGDLKGIEELLARPPKEDVARAIGGALTEAVGKMELDAARRLIDAGADLNAAEGYEKRRGSSPLAAAAESWHRRSKEAMRLLVDAGADVDQRGRYGRTPLMYAVLAAYRHGAPLRKAIPFLLEAGADPNLEDEFGLTAWSLAKAPLIEAEERARLGDAFSSDEPFFDGPDLSDLMTEAANRADQRQDRLKRCRKVLELLDKAGAKPHGEASLRLLMAAVAGDEERVAELLQAGASADARGADGHTAIAAAAEGGHNGIVARLIAAGCNVDDRRPGEPSALEIAVRNLDETMTRQLIDAGANVLMMAAMSSRRPLAAAEAAGGSEVVAMVREALPPEMAHIDREIEAEIAADDLTYESQLELPRQAAFGDLEKVRELLATDGVEVDGYDIFRRTALMAAAEAGEAEMVRQLIALGADVNKGNEVVGSPRTTPLSCAAISSSAERDRILRLLLEAGADPDRLGADGRTALMHAVERDVGFFGRIGEFALSTRTLIEAGADLEIRDPYGLTAYMRALSLASSMDLDEVAERYQELGELLEKAGASTAGLAEIELVWAVVMAETERLGELLAAGADPNARRHDGATALMLAVRDGERKIAERLISAGCDVEARQWIDRGPTAMDAAVAAGNQPIYRMLIAAGATPPERED